MAKYSIFQGFDYEKSNIKVLIETRNQLLTITMSLSERVVDKKLYNSGDWLKVNNNKLINNICGAEITSAFSNTIIIT